MTDFDLQFDEPAPAGPKTQAFDLQFDEPPPIAPAPVAFDAAPGALTPRLDATAIDGMQPIPLVPTEEDERAKDLQLRDLLKATIREAPDKAARAYELSNRTGAPLRLVKENLQKFDEAAQLDDIDIRAWRYAHPELEDLAITQPALAAAAMRDEKLSAFGKLLRQMDRLGDEGGAGDVLEFAAGPLAGVVPDLVSAAVNGLPEAEAPRKVAYKDSEVSGALDIARDVWSRRRKSSDLAAMGEKQWTLDAAILVARTSGDQRQVARAEHASRKHRERTLELRQEIGATPDYGQGSFGQLGVEAVEALAGQVDSFKAGGIGGGLGAAIGLVATRSGAGAKAGLSLGFKLGAFYSTFQQEGGSAYLDLLDAKDDQGKPVDRHVAMGMSAAYGLTAAGVEVATLGPSMRAFGPLGEFIAGGNGKVFARSLMADSTKRGMLKEIGQKWAESTVAEGAEEGAQAFLEWMAKYGARSISAGQAQRFDGADLRRSVREATEKGLVGAGLGLGAAQVSVSLATESMRMRGEQKAGKQVAAIVGLADSPIAHAAPKEVARYVAGETARHGQRVTHLYVDPAKLTEALAKEDDAGRAVVDLLGDNGAERMRTALAEAHDAPGGRNTLEIPVAEFLERWGTKPIAAAMLQDMTTRPGYLTARELAAAPKVVEEAATKVEAGAEVEPGPNEAALVDGIASQFVATGRATEDEARVSIASVRKFVTTMAERMGRPADELFAPFAVAVQRAQAVDAGAAPAAKSPAEIAETTIERLNQAAWHGTPRRDIKRFSLGSIGSGEGMQDHGWGLYFSQKREIAEWYRETLSDTGGGQVHRVEIPDDSDLLDYDAPLSGQPAGVLAKLRAATDQRGGPLFPTDALDGPAALSSGREVYAWLRAWTGSAEAASTALREAGIPGLRYLAGEARASGEGARNFVIWSEEAITNLETLYQPSQTGPGDIKRGWVDMARTGIQRAFKIFLGDKSDLSTFLHESAHVYFEMLGDMAAQDDAPAAVKADYAKALKFLGAASREEVTEKQKEKFARGFEAYLREGKAPSAALAEAFQAFKLWLSEIYRSAAELNVELNDDIRGVFERMLATDSEIARMKSVAGLDVPVFSSAEEAGVTPEEFERYLASRSQSFTKAAWATQREVAQGQLRATKAFATSEFRKLLAEAEAEFDKRPDWRAWRLLKAGEVVTESGEVLKTEGGKLNKEAVRAILGKDNKLEPLLKGRVTKDGEHPDAVAERMGYPTGRAMLEALVAMPNRAETAQAMAEERMRERHPEIEGELARLDVLVQKTLHNEGSIDWLLKEIAYLRKKSAESTGEGAVLQGMLEDSGDWQNTPLESIKEAAQNIAAKRTAGILNPNAVLNRERAAAERAALAMGKGNFKLALVEKQQQLLQHYLWRELTQAVEDREAFLALGQKLGRDKYRERLGKAGPAYRDVVDSLLEAVELSVVRTQDVPRKGLEALVTAMRENGDEPAFDQDIIARLLAAPQSWKELPVSEMREVWAALRNIKKAATNRNTVLIDGKRFDREQVIAAILGEIHGSELVPERAPPTSSASSESLLDKALGFGASGDAYLLRQETMLGFLGGGIDSMIHRAVIAPLQEAKYAQTDLIAQTVRPIAEAFDKLPKHILAQLSDSIDGAALFPSHRKFPQPPKTKLELFVVGLNRGNASSLQRLTEGRGITVEQIDAALPLLGRETLEYMQTVLDAIESLWEPSRALDERDRGLAPEKIAATPYDLTLADGTVIHMRGGYYPAVYDRRFEAVGAKQAEVGIAAILGAPVSRPATSRSRLKSRADDFSGVISLDTATIQSHLVESVHDLAFRERLRGVANVLLDPRIQSALNERLGEERAAKFKPWLTDIGRLEATNADAHAGDLARAGRSMKANMPKAILGYAADNAAGDLTGFATVMIESGLDKTAYAAALHSYSTSPGQMRAWALEKSGELRTRADEVYQGFERGMRDMVSSGKWPARAARWFGDHAFFLQEKIEEATVTPVWVAAYHQALKAGRPEAGAVEFANTLVRNAFPAKSVVDKASQQRDRNFLGMMMSFVGYANFVYNLDRRIWQPVLGAKGGRAKLKAAPRAVLQHLALMTLVGPVSEFLVGRGPEEDEEWAAWYGRKLMMAHLMPVPLVGGLTETLMGKQPSVRQAPFFAFFDEIGRVLVAASKDDADWLDVGLQAVKAYGFLTGLPVMRPVRALDYLIRLGLDETDEDPVEGVIYGDREGKPKNPLDLLE